MRRSPLLRALPSVLAAAVVVGMVVGPSACGSGHTDGSDAATTGDCPVEPVTVVVSVDQWADIVERLGGDCARVTTIVTSSTADPHGFEPTPVDLARFGDARLVVLNGLGYDDWARRAVAATGGRPEVVDAGKVAGRTLGDNPHVWYSPSVVRATADAVTARLTSLAPEAAPYLDARHAAWEASLAPYDAEIARISAVAAGRTDAATEPVFDDMAAAVGLRDVTPPGYRRAARNQSEPAPADVAAFRSVLSDGSVDVLIVNTQTQGALTESLRRAAGDADVPVLDVTETLPSSASSFVDWQVGQLRSLAKALGA